MVNFQFMITRIKATSRRHFVYIIVGFNLNQEIYRKSDYLKVVHMNIFLLCFDFERFSKTGVKYDFLIFQIENAQASTI